MSPQTAIENDLSKGQAALSKGSFEEAENAFAAAVDAAPKNLDALLGQAEALKKLDRTEDALHALYRARYHYPDDKRVLTALGGVLVDAGNYREAVETLDHALALDAGNQQAHVLKLRALRLSGSFEGYGKILEEALARQFEDPRPIFAESARALLHQKKYDEAVEAFAQAGDLDGVYREIREGDSGRLEFVRAATRGFPRDPRILSTAASFYLNQKEFREASEMFARALALEPDSEVALAGRIAALSGLRPFDPVAAEAAIAEARRRAPDSRDVLGEAFQLYVKRGRFVEAAETLAQMDEDGVTWSLTWHVPAPVAREVLDAARIRFARNARILTFIAQQYQQLRQIESALGAFEAAIAIDSAPVEAWKGKIGCLLLKGTLDQAVEAITDLTTDQRRALAAEIAEVYALKKRYADAAEAGLAGGGSDPVLYAFWALRNRKQATEAANLLDAALSLRPRDPALLGRSAWLHLGERRFETALTRFGEALTVSPDDENLVCGKIDCLRGLGRSADAQQFIEAALHSFGRTPALLYEQGWVYYEDKQYSKALEAFDESLTIERTDRYALLARVVSLKAQRKYDDAAKAVAEALERVPDDVGLLFEQAQLYYRRENFPEAERCYRAALKQDPGNAAVVDALTRLLARLDRRHEALHILEKANAEDPENVDLIMYLGWFYLAGNNYERARTQFSKLEKQARGSVQALNAMGALYVNLRKYADAEEKFRRTLKAEPLSASFHANVALSILLGETAERASTTYLPSGGSGTGSGNAPRTRLDEAERFCRKALDLDPNLGTAYATLGLIEAERGRLNEAVDHLREAVELDPESCGDLGSVLLRCGRHEEAEQHLKAACKIHRMDTRPRIDLGDLYLRQGKRDLAIPLFREAVTLDPSDESAPRALAIALLRGGDFDEARRVLRQALNILDKDRRWHIHLTLCQLLIELGDKNSDPALYQEALKEVATAISLKGNHPDPHFYAGVVHFRLDDLGRSLKSFQQCLDLSRDPLPDAEQNIRRVRARIQTERWGRTGSVWIALFLSGICVAGLIGLWWLYLNQAEKDTRISSAMLTTLTPLLLAFTLLSLLIPFLLPYLNKLKLPGGVEAELSQPKDKLSTSPTGLVGFGSASFSTRTR